MSSRLVTVVAFAAIAVVLAAAPAAAHSRASDATNFDSRLEQVPEIPGVSWRTYDGGLLVEIINTGAREVVVVGYDGEPYLRIGPDGVFENLNSPAAYLNRDRYADVAVPPRADPDASADWVRIADDPRHAWHDHRTHWMSPELPREVAGAPREHHLVMTWTVPLRSEGEEHALVGELHWDPPVRPGGWALLAIGFAVVGVAGLRRVRSRDAVLRAAAAGVGLVATANTVHLVDEIVARPQPLLDVAFGLLHTGSFTGAGLAACWWAWRPRDGRRLVLGVGAVAVAFHQGLLQLPALYRSQFETVWPPGLMRLLVVASLAQAVIVAAALWASRGAEPGADERGVPEIDGHIERGPSVPRGEAVRPVGAGASGRSVDA